MTNILPSKNMVNKSPHYQRPLLYNTYYGILNRCYNKNNRKYYAYGERGISVCDEWRGKEGYSNFIKWAISTGYKKGLSIDRIDVNGNYSPQNCRWADDIQQNNNRRINVYLEYQGEKHTLSEWSRITGVSKNKVYKRYKRGCSAKEILYPGNLTKSKQ